MNATAETLLRVKGSVRPRPDPLPENTLAGFALHAPWALAFTAFALAVIFLDRTQLGLVAGGAGWALLLAALARTALLPACHAAHLAGGVLTLGVLRGADEAGLFALASGVVLVSNLGARAWALHVTPEVAPLAGRVPWRFASAFRREARRFALAGLGLGVPLALFAPTPVLRVAGVAMLPLSLRSYLGSLLGLRATRAIWCLAVAVHVALLGFFVPAHGAVAAAWALVAAETVLFAGSAFVAARRTGVAPLSLRHLAFLCGGALVVALLTVPGPDLTILIGVALGVAGAAFLWRRRR